MVTNLATRNARTGVASSGKSLRQDAEVMEEIGQLLQAGDELPRMREVRSDKRAVANAMEHVGSDHYAEAIIQAVGRPSLLVQNGSFEQPKLQVWQNRLDPVRSIIEEVIPSVGRVELRHHLDFDWVGTAWIIENEILITNRHVAELFGRKQGNQFIFTANLFGQQIGARVDFREEFQIPDSFELEVDDILFIADRAPNRPDMAILKIKPHFELPPPLVIADQDPEDEQLVGVIGYPARDSRNGDAEMDRIFNDIFDVKRFAPGKIMEAAVGGGAFEHDCTTLGGNSGSPVIDLITGKVVGLHFAGRFMQHNLAVPASTIKQTLARRGIVTVPGGVSDDADEVRSVSDYQDRKGYNEEFLGDEGQLHVPLPTLTTALREDALKVDSDRRGMSAYALDYTHFSIVMSRSKKLALYTAVNIDGNQEVLLRRRRTKWKIDPRIPRDMQTGNELYRRNKLDRGHLVRRLDPVWGRDDVAKMADDDSFHYTNSAPQHAKLNQREWLKLEDHLLRHTQRKDLKLTVFTGPIYSDDDPVYRGAPIPQEFWKVIAMRSPDGGLHATAYLLSQTEFLDDIEFRFGAFRTYQVPISVVEQRTGILFGSLSNVDPLMQQESLAFHPIDAADDVIV